MPCISKFTSSTLSLTAYFNYMRRKTFDDFASMLSSSSGPTLEELYFYDDLWDFFKRDETPSLEHEDAETRNSERSLPMTPTLRRLFTPLASLHQLKRFTYDFPHTMYGLRSYVNPDLHLETIFYWKDQPDCSLVCVVVGKYSMTHTLPESLGFVPRRSGGSQGGGGRLPSKPVTRSELLIGPGNFTEMCFHGFCPRAYCAVSG